MKLQHSEPKYTILFRSLIRGSMLFTCGHPPCPNTAMWRWHDPLAGCPGLGHRLRCNYHDERVTFDNPDNVMVINHL